MATLPPVVLELVANGSKLSAGLDKATADIDKMTKSGATAFEKFSATAAKVGTAVGAAMTAAGAALWSVADDLGDAQANLAQSFQNTGHDIGEFKGQIDAAVKSQENLGNTAAQTNEALAKLTVGLNDPQKALDSMALAADLAATKHVSLADAAGLIVKASQGSPKLFKEFGISLEGLGTGAEAGAKGLEILKLKLEGQAAAQVDTIDVVRAKVTDFVAEVGQRLAPALQVAGPLILGVSQTVGVLGKAFQSSLGPIGLVIGVLGLMAAGYVALIRAGEKAIITTKDFATASNANVVAKLKDVKQAFEAANKVMADNQKLLADSGVQASAEGYFNLKTATKDLGEVTKDFNKILEKNPEYAQRFIDSAKEAGYDTEAWQGKLNELNRVTREHQAALEERRKALESSVGPMNDAADADRARASAVATAAEKDALAAARTKILTKAEEDQKTAAEELARHQQDVAKAIDDTYNAAENAIQPTLDFRGAMRDLASAAEDQHDKVKAATEAKGKDAEKNRDLEAAQDTLAEKVINASKKFAEQTGAVDGSVKSYDVQIAKLQELREKYAKELGPAGKDLDILIGKLAAARDKALELNQAASEYNPHYKITGNGTPSQVMAVGGWVRGAPGQPVPTILHGGEYVLSRDAVAGNVPTPFTGSPTGGGTGGGGLTLIVNAGMGTDGAQVGQQIVDKLKEYERSNGTSWRSAA